MLDAALERYSLFDRRGRLRTAWLQRLDSLITTAKGIDQMLGLERRPRQVDSIEQYLEKYNRPPGEQGE